MAELVARQEERDDSLAEFLYRFWIENSAAGVSIPVLDLALVG
jgi:hypothetical protein